jgi:hypothetical protein
VVQGQWRLVKAAVVYQLCWRITLRLEGKIAIADPPDWQKKFPIASGV